MLDGYHLNAIVSSGNETSNTGYLHYITSGQTNSVCSIVGGNAAMTINMNGNISYTAQLAFGFGTDYLAIRRKDGSTAWGSWSKTKAGYADSAGSSTTSTNSVNATNIHVTPTSDTIYFIGVTSSSEATGPAYQITNAMYYGNTTGIFFTSDKRRKHDITLIKTEEVSEYFKHSYFKHFIWNHNDKNSFGVIAQETEQWCPEAVNEENDYLAVNYQIVHSKAIAILTEKIKILEKQIERLTKLVTE